MISISAPWPTWLVISRLSAGANNRDKDHGEDRGKGCRSCSQRYRKAMGDLFAGNRNNCPLR